MEDGLKIYDRVDQLLDAVVGLKVVETGGVTDAAICNVCGAEIDSANRVVCRRCETPLHRECWRYNQKCAVFGCGSTEFH